MRWMIVLLAAGMLHGGDLENLMRGNERFTQGKLEHPNRGEESRRELTKVQNPFAIIVACSDSRVAPEILFDQGIGDLFVVRVAGNVIGPLGRESIGYSVNVLGSRLIMVLGHENCGAVNAVLTDNASTIPDIARKIRPAIKGDRTLEKATKDNVRAVVAELKKQYPKLQVVGGYYHLASGKVELLQ